MTQPNQTQAEEDVGRFLYAVANADMKRWPYRHFAASGLLDPSWIEALRTADLSGCFGRLRDQRGTRVNENRFCLHLSPGGASDDLPEPVVRLRRLFESPYVAKFLLDRFGELVGQRIRPVNGGYRTRASLDLIEDRTGYEARPHTDARDKLVTFLLYLDDEPAGPPLGTSIYVPKVDPGPDRVPVERSEFLRVATMPMRVNTGLCFAPCSNSFHGVEPVEAEGVRRLLAQFHLIAADPRDLNR